MGNQDKKFGHVMLDIETLAKYHNPAIISIAAVEFNMETGETGKEFHEKISLQSCLDIGLRVDESTIKFWMSQDDNARKKLYDGERKSINAVLLNFNSFIDSLEDDVEIWGNGISFDISFLRAAYFKANITFKWNHRMERDVRTLISYAPEFKENMKFIGVKHDALSDCKHQIRYCSATNKVINPTKVEDINGELLADLRNKLGNPYSLVQLVEIGLKNGFDDDLKKLLKDNTNSAKKVIEFLSKKDDK